MALTLNEAAKLSNDIILQGVIETIIQDSPILQALPFIEITGNGLTYNREHTWPKSYGFTNDGSGNYPYTDTHMLFLSDSGYNSSRGNKPYANCLTGCTERTTVANNGEGGGSGVFPGNSNWYDTLNWQTWGDRKGDVARAVLFCSGCWKRSGWIAST